jgi:hypothetical protein
MGSTDSVATMPTTPVRCIQLMRSLVDELAFVGTDDGAAVVLRCHLQRD